jgi:hypothetical protein
MFIGCAGFQCNENFGNTLFLSADWIVLQYGYNGDPINCWELKDTAITNEEKTDGIYWREPSGHMIHISGWYNRVQVTNNDWKGAALAVGVDDARCKDGTYLKASGKDGVTQPAQNHEDGKNK